ncbi:MAG: carboxyl-terminal processing protease [Rhodospirillaceae bacterium]|nr:carboxyl-terminal processing protease [Rhodospirillaceae bacterium]
MQASAVNMSKRDPSAQTITRRRFIQAVLFGGIIILPGLGAGPLRARGQTAEVAIGSADHAKIFDEVWQTVRDRFYDKALHGLDWDEVRQRYRPFLGAARDELDRARLINRMLRELGASHTEYYTPDEQAYYELLGIFSGSLRTQLQQIFPKGEVSYLGIGAYTRQLGGGTFVTGVLAGLPAERTGLRPGDQIVDVEGKPYRSIGSFRGKAGQSVTIRIRRQPDGPIESLAVIPEVIRPNEAFLEAMRRSARVIEKDGVRIGYIHVWSYAGYAYQELLMRELHSGALRDAQALVLDLRDGWGGAQLDYLEPFTDRIPTMSVIARNGNEELENIRWGKPVAMLVNGGTRSGKEILADAFKRYRLGPVVGSHTAKAVLGARAYLMSDDSLLVLAVADVVIDGRRLEGVGVEPTVAVPFRIEYANGSDPQLDKAVSILAASR